MTRATIVGGALIIALVLLALATLPWVFADPAAQTSAAIISSTGPTPVTEAAGEVHQGFLYGRVTTVLGASYKGRLRWGG